MRCFLEHTSDTPIVSFHIATPQGTACEPLGYEGLVSHAAEMSFRGTGPLGREAFDEEVDSLGASLGIGTGRDTLSLHGTCLSRHLGTLFDLATSALFNPRFEEHEHEQLLRETRYELDDLRDDDASLAHRFFNRHVHPGYRYSRTSLGTEDSLGKITNEKSRSLHRRMFRPQDLILGVAGDLSDSHLQDLAQRLKGDSNALPITAPSLTAPPAPSGRRLLIVDKPERMQCQIVIGHLVPEYGSEAHELLHVAEVAFGGMFSSRLMQEIRVREGWSYGVQCTMGRGRGKHAFAISLAPSTEVCAPALARTLDMYSELRERGLSEEEFQFTRSYLQGSAAFETATANQRLFRSMQEGLYGLPKGYADGYEARLGATHVAQVNQACERYLSPDDLCVVVVASTDTALPLLQTLPWASIEVARYDSY